VDKVVLEREKMNDKLKILFSALFMLAGLSFLVWTIYDVFSIRVE
tara:strand:+ start:1534 stop:1668 length:135 start_codon:yes stop_codon:yes gene_type:complete